MELKGKVALVTGSSTGIGKEVAVELAKRGCKVAVTYHQEKDAQVLKECERHAEALHVPLNVTDPVSIKHAVESVTEHFGDINLLINNAGVLQVESFQAQTFEMIAQHVQVNLTGTMWMTRASLPYMKDGIIINVASVLAKRGLEEYTPYVASKWGVRGFTKSLACELPKPLRVYGVNPGLTATKMTDFKGIDPAQVADVVIRVAEESLNIDSGDDIDVPDYVP